MFMRTSTDMYLDQLEDVQALSPRVAGATTPAADLNLEGSRAYISWDGDSGYAIRPDGELVGVFSLVRGRGDALVSDAIARGAKHLNCFDGYLPTLYARHGFVEVRREPNWTEGGPDIVYMALEPVTAP